MPADNRNWLIDPHEPVLVTGSAGFIGSRVVRILLEYGFTRVRCLVRSGELKPALRSLVEDPEYGRHIELVRGNLLSSGDCVEAVRDARVVLHLAAGTGEKSFPDAFMNSVVATRNLLAACVAQPSLLRFVNVSSFAVYSNRGRRAGSILDETCPLESRPAARDAYTYAKQKQDELVMEYGRERGLPFSIVRPGYVYGPGKSAISGRVGLNPFGLFIHLGGSNPLPLTYVENCAEAIVLAGIVPGVNGEIFNVLDDDVPSSRRFLSLYKRHVRPFPSIYVPHVLSYMFCFVWERYSAWSHGQLPPVYNRRLWHAFWKRVRYSNRKLKTVLGWHQRVSSPEALRLYFQSCRLERMDA